MSTREVAYLIENYDLVLVDGQLQSRMFRPGTSLEFLRPHWDQIVEELERRVIPLQPLRKAQIEDIDPWRHATPGFERMEEAKALLAFWRRKGLTVRVDVGASIKALDLHEAQTFVAPAYLKPEMLWLLGENHPDFARLEMAVMRSAFLRPGGAA